MKPLAVFTVLLLLLVPLNQASAAAAAAPGRVVLTASMVQSAVDIEAAIIQATAGGSNAGIVILDGQEGAFEYDAQAEDVDVNIFVSNLVLQGINQAILHGGGINFDGMPLNNITIQGLKMHCPQDCITSPDGAHRNVTVKGNRLQAGSLGIQVGWTDSWLIQDNTIQAGWSAVQLISAAEVSILNNDLRAYIPVMLYPANGCQVTQNTIYAPWQGILLTSASQANLVTANTISGVQASGIALEPGTLENLVHGNRVACAVWAPDCLVVDDQGTDNNTHGSHR